jgi:hypothetical protein
MSVRTRSLVFLAAAALGLFAAAVSADVVVQQNFNTVTGTGGGTFLIGSGTSWTPGWDDGITGEEAFAGALGYAHVQSVAAYGTVNGGKNSTGAGIIDVTGVNYNLIDEPFNMVTGAGGGMFLAGNGTPNTSGSAAGWDTGIVGEQAYAGTYGGAAIQTGGGASAMGVPAGGVGGTGAGRIVMSNVTVGSGHWYGGLAWNIGAFAGAATFYNPGFEDGFAYWQPWGNAFAVTGASIGVTPHGGTYVLKMYGNFSGAYNTTGAFQPVPAKPGQIWSLSGFVQTPASDSISGKQNYVQISVEFYDASGAQVGTPAPVTVLNGSSSVGTWLPAGPLQMTAPAGTVSARAVFIFVQPAVGLYEGGSGLVDDVTFHIVGGPPSVDLSQHSLLADVQGAANGSGQTLGDIQLRIEDPSGNRRLFRTLANGSWQSVGGALSTAIETDPNGTPATGVFDADASSFSIIVAFDDEATHRWGSGGTLTLDNLRLTNTDTTGSAWYAGFDWPNIQIANPDVNQLRLTADVKGSVPAGSYQMRIEAQKDISTTLDQNFNTVVGDCGASHRCTFLDPNGVPAGGGNADASTTDWDTGITGERAYGGVYGGTEIYTGGGFAARGLPTGGVGGTGAGEIRVTDIILGELGSGWYAGLNWFNQHLASTDLTQVVLQADIKGEAVSGGSLGNFELRIEDPDGDRLYFPVTATGDWQHIGGPLSTALEGAKLGGGGDGHFNRNASSYNVVVAFADEADSWMWGGALRVDNLFLTPATLKQELGRITFPATATGDWQSIGGLLSGGQSTLQTLNEHFNTVTGTGGGEFWASGGSVTFGGQPWDTGITGEETFAGTWGSGTIATESASGCTNCGVGGTGAGVVSITGATDGTSGGWWAGLSWVVRPPDWTDPNLVFMTAKVKASKLAPFQLRLEDGSAPAANPVWLAFDHTATSTTTFESVGGPMSQGVHGCPNPPCAAFNYNAPYYRTTLIFSGANGADPWAGAGQLTIDDLFFTGIGFADADNYTVVVTFDNETTTWGTLGRLTVDNLFLGTGPVLCAGDMNCDGRVTFVDIDLFVAALSGESVWNVAHPNCPWLNADCNHDTHVTFVDIDPFVAVIGTTCH